MNNDLVTFLKARLDEEGDVARPCGGAGFSAEWIAHGAAVDFGQGDLTGFQTTIARHVALHDPARVLREVEAKQHVLNRHTLSPAENDPERPWDDRDDCQFDGDPWPCDDLLDLALPYQEHPDFPERYKPNQETEERIDRTTSAPDRAGNNGESSRAQRDHSPAVRPGQCLNPPQMPAVSQAESSAAWHLCLTLSLTCYLNERID